MVHKKGGKRTQRQSKKKQEDAFSETELSNNEYGFEYDFFMTKKNIIENNLSSVKHKKKPEKGENTQDQSKAFFLPDFFIHED